MKKALLAAAALAAMVVVPAIAADLGKPAPVYKPRPLGTITSITAGPPVYTWTGCYLGGGGGYGMWNQDLSTTFPPDSVPDFTSLTTTGGGRAGSVPCKSAVIINSQRLGDRRVRRLGLRKPQGQSGRFGYS